MKNKKEEAVAKKSKNKTRSVSDYKLLQYKGIQMSRKMEKVWNLTKIIKAGPKPAKKK